MRLPELACPNHVADHHFNGDANRHGADQYPHVELQDIGLGSQRLRAHEANSGHADHEGGLPRQVFRRAGQADVQHRLQLSPTHPPPVCPLWTQP